MFAKEIVQAVQHNTRIVVYDNGDGKVLFDGTAGDFLKDSAIPDCEVERIVPKKAKHLELWVPHEQHTRKLNVMINLSGGNSGPGTKNYRISLPSRWMNALGITPESRGVEMSLFEDYITIRRDVSSEEGED